MEKGLSWGYGIPHKNGREPALLPAPRLHRRLSSPEGFPTPKIALIREKTARMFWDIPAPWPIWLSGAFSQRKITANAPVGRRNSDFIGLADRERENGVIKLRKNPVDFTSALYPVKYNPVIGHNLTPDPVLPDTDTIIILKTPHLVDIKILENVL
jgi:hypothetical protein